MPRSEIRRSYAVCRAAFLSDVTTYDVDGPGSLHPSLTAVLSSALTRSPEILRMSRAVYLRIWRSIYADVYVRGAAQRLPLTVCVVRVRVPVSDILLLRRDKD